MSTTPVKLGSAEWMTATADKLLDFGMDVLSHKMDVDTAGGSGTKPGASVSTSMLEGKLPWILGGLAVVGIGIMLWKR